MAKTKIVEKMYMNKDGHTLLMTEKFEYERSIFNITADSFALVDSKIEKSAKFLPESEITDKAVSGVRRKETFVLIGAPAKWLIENKYT